MRARPWCRRSSTSACSPTPPSGRPPPPSASVLRCGLQLGLADAEHLATCLRDCRPLPSSAAAQHLEVYSQHLGLAAGMAEGVSERPIATSVAKDTFPNIS